MREDTAVSMALTCSPLTRPHRPASRHGYCVLKHIQIALYFGHVLVDLIWSRSADKLSTPRRSS